MATINQTFKSGQEYIFSISQVPEISTDTAVINFVGDTHDNLTARKISDTVFGLTYNGNSDTFTSNIQLVINGVSGYDDGLNVNFTINGNLAKESVRIYNPTNYQISVDIYRNSSSAPTLDIYYCVGSTEGTYIHYTNSTDYGSNPVKSITVKPNQSVWIYSDTMTGWSSNTSSYIYIKTPDYLNFNQIQLSGNIMSLITGDLQSYSLCYLFKDFKTLGTVSSDFLPATTLANDCYHGMFQGCTSLTTAPELPATKLTNSCYESMFKDCTSLIKPPKLSGTNLAMQYCYSSMFENCTSLTTAPELPATTLSKYCYANMFKNCTSLTTAPQLLATKLANGCYQFMFNGCTSLTTAPELPATTLDDGCYNSMFFGCTKLTTAPNLPATQLAHNCYDDMFNGCSNLNYVKALFLDTPAANNSSSDSTSTDTWLLNVSSTGTFVKNHNATWDVRGNGAVPYNWTIITDTEE